LRLAAMLAGGLLLGACSGSSSSPAGGTGGGSTGGSSGGTTTVYTPPAELALTTGEVGQVLAQAVAQAGADGHPAVISVVDRVGNVLALFRMTGAPATAHITDAPNGQNLDAQGLDVPAEAAAIAKAVTGAYLSSSGNAFSTRTASAIVQQQFPMEPGTAGLGSGPLYGVQFSQLPCSDLSQRFGSTGSAALIGPKRSPLGLAADPGGFPLYKNGVVVGGIGVEADGLYSYDTDALAATLLTDERIALAGTEGFDAPAGIVASRISVAGTLLSFSDVTTGQLAAVTGATWASAMSAGSLEPLTGYTAGTILAGTAYGSESSGIRAATGAEFANPDAFVLSDGAGNNRYPIRAGTDGADIAAPLTASEVQTILAQAFAVMSEARAQIRNPLNSLAQVSIAVVDTRGVALGLVRAPDAPIFGIDVSLQKARTAAFFSNAAAGAQLAANPAPRVAGYVGALRTFLGNPQALTGAYAFTDRAGGDLSRPTFPDGTVGNPQGPLSVAAAQFNPFATGLQSALIVGNLGQHLAYVTGKAAADTPQRCTTTPDVVPGQNRVQNGIQIFPGSVPIYRGTMLVGAIGVSGDGTSQDDMVAFLGLNNAGAALGTLGNAPRAIRADQITVHLPNGTSANLLYVNCPQAPFVNSNVQTPCQGL
jgi:uncharacterized protein GlcG (DUF336 family)